MNKWLKRLGSKKNENTGKTNTQNPQKEVNSSFEGFVGSKPSQSENILGGSKKKHPEYIFPMATSEAFETIK